MKESWEEEPATHLHLDPYADGGDIVGVASAGGTGRPAMELRNQSNSCADPVKRRGRQHAEPRFGERQGGTAESETPSMSGNSKRENREISHASQRTFDWERSANVSDGTAGMHASEKSDDPIVPAKGANNTATAVAESLEERGSPKGNDRWMGLDRALNRSIECPDRRSRHVRRSRLTVRPRRRSRMK